jgi:hypothetical protein
MTSGPLAVLTNDDTCRMHLSSNIITYNKLLLLHHSLHQLSWAGPRTRSSSTYCMIQHNLHLDEGTVIYLFNALIWGSQFTVNPANKHCRIQWHQTFSSVNKDCYKKLLISNLWNFITEFVVSFSLKWSGVVCCQLVGSIVDIRIM